MEMGVVPIAARNLTAFDGARATLVCEYTDRETVVEAEAVVLVTARRPNDALHRALTSRLAEGDGDAPLSVARIGDCEAPAIIAAAVFSGHRYARELDARIDRDNPFKHDRAFFRDV